MENQKKNLPERKFRAGAITATVWKNQTEKNGNIVEYSTISIERIYKNKQDEWAKSNSLRINDLPRAKLVLDKAYEFLLLKQDYASEEA